MPHHGAAERHALLLAARELRRLAGEELADIERRRRLAHFGRDAGSGGARAGQQPADDRQALPHVHAAHGERQADIVGDRHVRVERVALEHHGDVAVACRQAVDPAAADGDAAAVVAFEPGDDAQQGRLAAARGPQQRQELAVGDIEGDVAQDFDRAEVFCDFLEGNCGHVRGLSRFLLQESLGVRFSPLHRPG